MTKPTLFMIKIGAKPQGRLIEQHDIFFGVANQISELIPGVNRHWAEVADKWHFDAYRPVTVVDGYKIEWQKQKSTDDNGLKLFFINLGGYLPNEFEEFHHKLLVVANTQAEAVKKAKQSQFYQSYTCVEEGSQAIATSHVDDKMQVDVDDIYDVNGLLSHGALKITPLKDKQVEQDKSVIGYISLKSFK